MYKYMRDELEDEYGILELQDKILEAMVYLDDFMKAHKIKYILDCGSALGAVRHHGFIPWDDDFDIIMNYDNYQKFIEACEKDLDKERYYLQKENTSEFPQYYSKIRINNTTYIEDGNNDGMHQGIFIDIFCYYNAPNNNFARKKQKIYAALLQAEALSKLNYKSDNISKKILLKLGKVINKFHCKNFLYQQFTKYNKRDTKCYTNMLSVGVSFGKYFPKNLFDEIVYTSFEKIKLPISKNAKDILEIIYGKDYMTPKIQIAHNKAWSTAIDYKNYRRDNK